MGEYLRTTREATENTLNPALAAAIRAHIEKYELGEREAAGVVCCETTATKQKRGLFGGKTEVILTGVMLTSQWLIWAVRKNNGAPHVQSARLRDIQVQDYERSEMYTLVQDTGITVLGLQTDTTEVGSTFLGFGLEPAAQSFRAALKEALAKTQ